LFFCFLIWVAAIDDIERSRYEKWELEDEKKAKEEEEQAKLV